MSVWYSIVVFTDGYDYGTELMNRYRTMAGARRKAVSVSERNPKADYVQIRLNRKKGEVISTSYIEHYRNGKRIDFL